MPARCLPPNAGASLAERTSLEATAARAKQSMQARAEQAQAQRLAAEQAQLTAEQGTAADSNPSRQVRRQLERRAQALHTRELRLLRRDDALVHAVLARKGTLEAVVPLAGSTAGDEFLWFVLEHLGLRDALAQLRPPSESRDKEGKAVAHRTMYGPDVLGLLGLIARWTGLGGGAQVQASLLCDVRWMALLGFGVQEVDEGSTRRSEGLKGKTRNGHGAFVDADQAGPVREDAFQGAPRGAPSSQTLAGFESALAAETVNQFYNAVVQALVRHMRLRGRRNVVVDTTLCEVPPKFTGGGRTRRKVKVVSKAKQLKVTEASVYGFKVWTAMDAETGLVLAACIDTGEKPDNLHVVALKRPATNAPRLGILRYRRLLDPQTRDQVLVIAEQAYTVLPMWELMRYAGFDVVSTRGGLVVRPMGAPAVSTSQCPSPRPTVALAGRSGQATVTQWKAPATPSGRAPSAPAPGNRPTSNPVGAGRARGLGRPRGQRGR